MKRVMAIVLSAFTVAGLTYFAASKWAIRHETLTFFDTDRNREVDVSIAVRRDKEFRAAAGATDLPVAILNHGNTVRFTEYSFLANLFAARGYMAVSIQHDLATDAPLVTKPGELYVGRMPVYERGVQNIHFATDKLKLLYPDADFRHLTLVGHSNGGDISMYYAKRYPDEVSKIVTLDNLRVPFLTDGRFKILSVRSDDPHFKPDPGVVPDDDTCKTAGITVVKTEFQHTDMSDRGPEKAKTSIQAVLDRFLKTDSQLAAVPMARLRIVEPPENPVSQYTPLVN